MDGPNLFILLDLNCNERDPAKIEAAIREEEAAVEQTISAATQGGEEPRPDQDVRGDTERSEEAREEAERCEKLRAGAKAQALKELQLAVELLRGKGHILDTEVSALVKDFQGRLSEEEVRGSLVGIELRSKGRSSGARKRDRSRARSWGKSRRRSKSSTNGISTTSWKRRRTSSPSLLHAKAQSTLEMVRVNNNKNALVTAQAILCGHCVKIFADENGRANYDSAVTRQAL